MRTKTILRLGIGFAVAAIVALVLYARYVSYSHGVFFVAGATNESTKGHNGVYLTLNSLHWDEHKLLVTFTLDFRRGQTEIERFVSMGWYTYHVRVETNEGIVEEIPVQVIHGYRREMGEGRVIFPAQMTIWCTPPAGARMLAVEFMGFDSNPVEIPERQRVW